MLGPRSFTNMGPKEQAGAMNDSYYRYYPGPSKPKLRPGQGHESLM